MKNKYNAKTNYSIINIEPIMRNLKKCLLFITLLAIGLQESMAQEKERMYHLNLKVDIPLTVIGLGATYFGFQRINAKGDSDHNELRNLDKNDINAFDRSAAGNVDEKAEKMSDVLFYGAFPFGVVLLADGQVRSELGTIGLMYLEALAISSSIYATTNGNVDRFRPLTYQDNANASAQELEDMDYGGNRNSFIGGHPMITATTTFFVAKVYSDMHPENNFKYALWGFAGLTTTANAYLRYKAGKHFPTDLIAGVSVGTLSGILVPQFHKKKRSEGGFSLSPMMGYYNGLAMNYTF